MSNEKLTIPAQIRSALDSKGKTRALRKEGVVPAVIYGRNTAPVSIQIAVQALPAGHTRSQVVQIDLEGKSRTALMREVQVHPLKDHVVHIDFQEVAPDEVVNLRIPLNFVGLTREQEKEGSFRIHVRSIPVRCKVKDAPASVDVPIGHLKIEDSSYLGDVNLGDSVRIIGQKNMALATLAKL